MLFVILWEADAKLVPNQIPIFSPPEDIKPISEYVTPNGLFIEIVETENGEAIFDYVNKGISCCTKVEVYPILPIKGWLKAFRPDFSQ